MLQDQRLAVVFLESGAYCAEPRAKQNGAIRLPPIAPYVQLRADWKLV